MLPTQIIPQTATLIELIYYLFHGTQSTCAAVGLHTKSTDNFAFKDGNFTADISDHLPNFLLLINSKD
jgi:hypothetical protein